MRRLGSTILFLLSCCADNSEKPPPDPAPTQQQLPPQVVYPPAVLLGDAELQCDIDAKRNGIQKLVLRSGTGLEFDAVVSPIVNGTVDQNGPDKGGAYRFSSHLAQPAPGKLSGVGEVQVVELETR